MKPSLNSTVVLFLCLGVCAHAQNHWDQYEPRTLKSIVDAHRETNEFRKMDFDKHPMFVSANGFASQVRLQYLGSKRQISGGRATLLETWRKMRGQNAPDPDVFTTEILFKEGAEDHWILVQKQLLDSLSKEIVRGGSVNGYVMWIGAIKVNGHWEWLFAMNEFVNCPQGKKDCSL